jgi:hypothetical protein
VLDSLIGPFESTSTNIVGHLSNCTLDIIGLAGFGYHFNALSLADGQNELSAAFSIALNAAQSSVALAALEWPFPVLRSLVSWGWLGNAERVVDRAQPTARNNIIRTSLSTMRRIGTQLLQERKAAAASVHPTGPLALQLTPRQSRSCARREDRGLARPGHPESARARQHRR